MAKQKTNKTDSQPKCVELWQRAKTLCTQGIESLWERTKILCELIEDDEFLRRFVQADEAITDIFQREVLWDTTVSFAELRTVWEHCNDKAAWHDKGIATLLDEAAESNASEPGPERERPRWKDIAADLQRQLDELRAENAALRAENRELRKLVAEPVAA